MNKTEKYAIASEIIRQLGNKAICMIGARNFSATENSVVFKIGKNDKKVTHIKIALNGLDLYDITYIRCWGVNIKTMAESNNIYADMMHTDIEENTGMRTSL